MPLGGLQHYTIEPQDLERTKDFYVDVLGLENGERTTRLSRLLAYSGGQATVHLMGLATPREGIVVRGTEKKYEDTGRLDHIAFAGTDVDGVRKRLQAKNVKFREQVVLRTGDTQVFLYDPDGVGVELTSRRPEALSQEVSAGPVVRFQHSRALASDALRMLELKTTGSFYSSGAWI